MYEKNILRDFFYSLKEKKRRKDKIEGEKKKTIIRQLYFLDIINLDFRFKLLNVLWRRNVNSR